MKPMIPYIIFSYLAGSILFANVFGTLFGKKDLYQNSADKNPGTANAFKYGGFWCGLLTLLGDLLKGFLPVYLYLQASPESKEWALPFVLLAPVAGHIFSIFHKFHGGKGIATTFGCLLGLYPYMRPVFLLAVIFILLSVGLTIKPDFYRTIAAYVSTSVLMLLTGVLPAVCAGFFMITVIVCLRLHLSKETREKLEVKLLWMR